MNPRSPRREPSDSPQEPSVELGALRDSVGFFILRASRKLTHEWANRRYEHRALFYYAFALIGANPGISPAQLSRFLVLDKSRACDLIDALEAERSITRRRHSEDHRRLGIYLTPAGTARLATFLAQMQEQDREIHQLFDVNERRRLIAALQKIAEEDAPYIG